MTARPALNPDPGAAAPDAAAFEARSIGHLLARLRQLGADQVEQIVAYQRQHGVRFGEAAVALGHARPEDVSAALSEQFHYPYAAREARSFGPELVAFNEPFSDAAEKFRALRSQLTMRLAARGEPRRALAVISAAAGDGKTYCAANLAITLAQLGGRTLLVDADMRTPRLHELFKLDNRVGLSGLLSGRCGIEVVKAVPGTDTLSVLPSGAAPPNPLELVERPAFAQLLRELSTRFDHLVFDTPAAAQGSDAIVVAARCGAALLVARRHKSRLAMMQQLVDGFRGSAVELTGVVLNEA